MPALSQFVDEGELPHGDLLIARHGKVCYRERFGYFDVEAKTPLPDDALFRVYSMTKVRSRGHRPRREGSRSDCDLHPRGSR